MTQTHAKAETDTDEIVLVDGQKYPNPYFTSEITQDEAEAWLQAVAQGDDWPTIEGCHKFLPVVWKMYQAGVILPREQKVELMKDLSTAKPS